MKIRLIRLIHLFVFILISILLSPNVPMAQEPAVGQNKKEESVKDNNKKTDDDEKDPKYWYNKGVLLSVYGNYAAAIESFKKAIELDPQNPKAHFQLGIAYGEQDDFKRALSAVTKALELDPDNGAYYYGRGRIYLMSGNKEQALEDFKVAANYGSREAVKFLKKIQPAEDDFEPKSDPLE